MEEFFFKESFNKLPEEKKSRILDAAFVEFAEHGFDSANINVIAQKSAVSVGSLYKYFDNKEDLFLSLVHYGVGTMKTILDEIVREEASLETRVRKIIRAIQKYTREQEHFTMLYNEMTTESRSGLVWKIVSDMENATAGVYTDYIKEAQKQGEVRADVEAGYMAFFLDNLFIMLQFSYACEYYRERMKIFVGETAVSDDAAMEESLMKFIHNAFMTT